MKYNGIRSLGVLSGMLLISGVAAGRGSRADISPELEPVSDHKFFKHDYPDDQRAPVMHAVEKDYPYPTIQDSERYDTDYVRDENDDHGYWKAQMEYDGMKNKVIKEHEELKRALQKLQKEEADVVKAKAREEEAERLAAQRAKEENAADKVHDGAEEDLATAKSRFVEGTEKVEKEVNDLEECKKQLEDAKKELEALLKEKEIAAAHQKEREAAEKLAEEKELARETEEHRLEQLVDKERAEYDAAKKDYNAAMDDMKPAEDELEKAAKQLRKFRHADPDGGVYEKAGANRVALLPATLLMTAAAALL